MNYNIQSIKIFLIFLAISFFSIYCFVYNELIASKLTIKASKFLNGINVEENNQNQNIKTINTRNNKYESLNNGFEKIEFNTKTDLISLLHIPKTGINFFN